MFIEPRSGQGHKGWIEVVCGCMFSGKTEELLRRLRRAKIANQKVEIFKPALDTRYDETEVVSHDSNAIHSTPVLDSIQIPLLCGDVQVVGIDEAQFFDKEIIYVCETLASRGVRVIVAGLDMDYLGVPFGPMPNLMAVADYVTKVHAICVCCGDIAMYSYRKNAKGEQVLLGEMDIYEPRCRTCFDEGMKQQNIVK